MVDVCLSKKDIKRLGGLLEDRLVEDTDKIYGRDGTSVDYREVIAKMIEEGYDPYAEPSDKEKARIKASSIIDDRYRDLFIKVKKCSCTLPTDMDRWEDLFKKGAVPWE